MGEGKGETLILRLKSWILSEIRPSGPLKEWRHIMLCGRMLG